MYVQSRTSAVRTGRIHRLQQFIPNGVGDTHQRERNVRVQALHAERIALPGDADRGARVVTVGLDAAALTDDAVGLAQLRGERGIRARPARPIARSGPRTRLPRRSRSDTGRSARRSWETASRQPAEKATRRPSGIPTRTAPPTRQGSRGTRPSCAATVAASCSVWGTLTGPGPAGSPASCGGRLTRRRTPSRGTRSTGRRAEPRPPRCRSAPPRRPLSSQASRPTRRGPRPPSRRP